jgi:thiol-disulfide isomerase/thioredoxin
VKGLPLCRSTAAAKWPAILRIDGDTGSTPAHFKDGKWVLSHFDGGRPGVIVVTPKADGTLEIRQQVRPPRQGQQRLRRGQPPMAAMPPAWSPIVRMSPRPGSGRARRLPQPHQGVDPNAKFTFNFPDNSGKLISQDDPRFKGKVVVAVVTGTWCPNCHDEAQYLVQLDKKYRDKGLAIVALNFEEPDQQDTLKRQKAFVKQYGVKYTYLTAGSPAQMWEKVPQLNHLDTWPATVFIGRDGKVKAVHSGFASPASGEFHAQLQPNSHRGSSICCHKSRRWPAEQPAKLALR